MDNCEDMEITNINQLDLNGTYTYADYLLWKFQERVELFKGKVLKMSPAPASNHQKVALNITGLFWEFFKGKQCDVYPAPFDVRLPNSKGEIFTVVQPDLSVICDKSKIDERGCLGAPDLVIEILSPGNSKKEMGLKFNLYEESGVLEYWMVFPTEKSVQIFVLENGKYIGLKPIIEDENVVSTVFPELNFPAKDIFENL